MAPQPASLQTLADYLAAGYWAEVGEPAHEWATGDLTVDLSGLTAAGRSLARMALDGWAMVADLSFAEVVDPLAEILFRDDEAGAWSSSVWWEGPDDRLDFADVNVGLDWLATYGTAVGGYGFQTYLHEVGHALGLGHAGNYNGSAGFDGQAKFQNDSWQLSLMSYFDQDQNPYVAASFAWVITPQMADILAIQSKYGLPEDGPSFGDTVWGLGSTLGTYLDAVFQGAGAGLRNLAMTIWDPSGVDSIDFSNDSYAQTVDLRPGLFSSTYGEKGNLGIAGDTVIENYAAGSGSDFVRGNDAANRLALNGGDDTAYGGLGADRLLGGAGADSLFGEAGGDRLEGGSGNDRLNGGTEDDLLIGGAGADALTGGSGIDTASYEGATAAVRAALDAALTGLGDAAGDSFAADIENLLGSAFADTLRGNALGNLIQGGDGADALHGRSGADRLEGGGGADKLYGGGAADLLWGGAGGDTFAFAAAADSTVAASDVIADFEDGIDRISLSAIDANGGMTGNQAFRFDTNGVLSAGEVRQQVEGGNLVLLLNTDSDSTLEGRIVLQGVTTLLTSLDVLL